MLRDTDTHRNLGQVWNLHFCGRGSDAFCETSRACGIGLWQEDCELLATPTTYRIGFPNPVLKRFCERSENLVTFFVTKLVVNVFEVVSIQNQNAIANVMATLLMMGVFQQIQKVASIPQASQRVA